MHRLRTLPFVRRMPAASSHLRHRARRSTSCTCRCVLLPVPVAWSFSRQACARAMLLSQPLHLSGDSACWHAGFSAWQQGSSVPACNRPSEQPARRFDHCQDMQYPLMFARCNTCCRRRAWMQRSSTSQRRTRTTPPSLNVSRRNAKLRRCALALTLLRRPPLCGLASAVCRAVIWAALVVGGRSRLRDKTFACVFPSSSQQVSSKT